MSPVPGFPTIRGKRRKPPRLETHIPGRPRWAAWCGWCKTDHHYNAQKYLTQEAAANAHDEQMEHICRDKAVWNPY